MDMPVITVKQSPEHAAYRDNVYAAASKIGMSQIEIGRLLGEQFDRPVWLVVKLDHLAREATRTDLTPDDKNYIRVNAGLDAQRLMRAMEKTTCAQEGLKDAARINSLAQTALRRYFWGAVRYAREQMKAGEYIDAANYIRDARSACLRISGISGFYPARLAVMSVGFANSMGLRRTIDKDSPWYDQRPKLKNICRINWKYRTPAKPII
jgi:hypothetical protein